MIYINDRSDTSAGSFPSLFADPPSLQVLGWAGQPHWPFSHMTGSFNLLLPLVHGRCDCCEEKSGHKLSPELWHRCLWEKHLCVCSCPQSHLQRSGVTAHIYCNPKLQQSLHSFIFLLSYSVATAEFHYKKQQQENLSPFKRCGSSEYYASIKNMNSTFM